EDARVSTEDRGVALSRNREVCKWSERSEAGQQGEQGRRAVEQALRRFIPEVVPTCESFVAVPGKRRSFPTAKMAIQWGMTIQQRITIRMRPGNLPVTLL